MSNKEKLYHWVNIILIPLTVISGVVLGISSVILDAISRDSSFLTLIVTAFAFLSMIIVIIGVLWVFVSGLINESIRTMAIKGVKGIFKTFMGLFAATGWAVCLLAPFEMVAAFFIILIVFGLIFFVWEVAIFVMSIYLFITSIKALRTNTSIFF